MNHTIRVTVLIDNSPARDNASLLPEHGLSLLVETAHQRILYDMGASARFMENARLLGIDLSTIDYAFLSHGHADHTGGLEAYLSHFPQTPIYLAQGLFDARYYSYRRGARRDISTPEILKAQYSDRFRFLPGSQWLSDEIAAVRNQSTRHPKPEGNRFLVKETDQGEMPDDFSHELALAIKSDRGLVILSACSHGGALNIIESCRAFTGEEKVAAFIGGLHFVDSEQTSDETRYFSKAVRAHYPQLEIHTGHCTGDLAKRQLLHVLPQLHLFATGDTFLI